MKNILTACIFFLPSLVLAQSGTLDRSFGDTGVALYKNISGGFSTVALQSDGKILAGGRGGLNDSIPFLIARYNLDGSLDNTFGNSGVTGNIELSHVFAMAVQPDDNIVAARHSATDVVMVRYKKDGGVDSSFGNNGIVITNIGKDDITTDVVIQPDDKIVAGGWILNADNEPRQGFLVRYMPDGSLDKSFANKGILIFDQVTYNIYSLSTIALQQDGKILIAGNSTSLKGIIFRFNADGSIDKNFGTAGEASADIIINDIVVKPDGNILLGGSAADNMVVSQLPPDGAIAENFGIKGLASAQFGDDVSEGNAVLYRETEK